MIKKPKTSTVLIILSCFMAVSYAVAAIVLQWKMNVEVSPTLTTFWYGFWGVELINLANIKNTKVKHESDNKKQ